MNSGRIEVFIGGRWGTVCDDYWDISEAEVVCKHLGFTGAESAWASAFFGEGIGLILLDNVHCLGNESTINDCIFKEIGHHDCTHSEDAGVVCSDGTVAGM